MMDQKKKKQKPLRVWNNNWFILKLSFRTAPVFMIYMIFEQVKQSGLVFLEHIYGIRFVLEAAEFHKPFLSVIKFLLIVFGAWGTSFIFSGIYQNYVSQKGLPKIQKKLKEIIYEKTRDLDLACYDDPAYYNEFVLTVSEAENSITRAHKILEAVTYGIVVLLTNGIFFLTVDSASLLFVGLSFVLSFIFNRILNRINYNNRLERNPRERKRGYVHRLFYLNEYAKEVRLNPGIKERLYEEFEETNEELKEIEKRYAPKRVLLTFTTNYLTNYFISDVVYVSYLVFRAAVQHAISYSSIVVLWNSQGHLKYCLRNFAKVIPQLAENSLYIEKIRNFLSYERKIISRKNLPLPTQSKTLELREVCFGYNENDGYIINHVSMTIHPNEKTALVGYNGAGKTTLIKLIMRLYDPDEGEILYDGVNIKDYKVEEYRNVIGTIFQDFKIFAATVGENVILDEEAEAVMKRHEPAIQNALSFSGFKDRLGTLPHGLATELTTEFDEEGMDLSGGESQKLAIARAFYKDAGMVILDEPSSALDPIAEYQLNRTMLEAAAYKTVIFISHRLSTTRGANRIFMLEKGRIIEEGTHEELLRKKGKYSEMWKVQAGKYVDF